MREATYTGLVTEPLSESIQHYLRAIYNLSNAGGKGDCDTSRLRSSQRVSIRPWSKAASRSCMGAGSGLGALRSSPESRPPEAVQNANDESRTATTPRRTCALSRRASRGGTTGHSSPRVRSTS